MSELERAIDKATGDLQDVRIKNDPSAIAVYRYAQTGLVVAHVFNVMVRKAYRPLYRVVESGTSTYRKNELAMVNVYGDGWERVRGD